MPRLSRKAQKTATVLGSGIGLLIALAIEAALVMVLTGFLHGHGFKAIPALGFFAAGALNVLIAVLKPVQRSN